LYLCILNKIQLKETAETFYFVIGNIFNVDNKIDYHFYMVEAPQTITYPIFDTNNVEVYFCHYLTD